jgi:PKHD-type hydroxylase
MTWLFNLDNDKCDSFVVVESVFSSEEIDNIIQLGLQSVPQPAKTLGSYPDGTRHDEGSVQLDRRKSKISWIPPEQNTEWLFRKLTDVVVSVNKENFCFDLLGFAEGMQFTIYEEDKNQFKPHIDRAFGHLSRKLSIVVQLSNSDDYDGGELCLYVTENGIPMTKKKGSVILFPSFMLHGVRPVTRGTRYSLVAWITGPSFR